MGQCWVSRWLLFGWRLLSGRTNLRTQWQKSNYLFNGNKSGDAIDRDWNGCARSANGKMMGRNENQIHNLKVTTKNGSSARRCCKFMESVWSSEKIEKHIIQIVHLSVERESHCGHLRVVTLKSIGYFCIRQNSQANITCGYGAWVYVTHELIFPIFKLLPSADWKQLLRFWHFRIFRKSICLLRRCEWLAEKIWALGLKRKC